MSEFAGSAPTVVPTRRCCSKVGWKNKWEFKLENILLLSILSSGLGLSSALFVPVESSHSWFLKLGALSVPLQPEGESGSSMLVCYFPLS